MKKVKFIYNPHSGHGEITNFLDLIIEKYQKKGYQIVPYRIDFSREIEITDDEYNHILISGGDGTINRVINILKNENRDIPIALLPAGTANDFAKYIGMVGDIGRCVDKILDGEIHSVDLGRVNDKYFINVFSFGLFTDVSQKTPTHMKNIMGKLAYYINGIKEVPTFKKIKVKIEAKNFEYDDSCLICFVFNGRTAGNIKISYKSEIDDGLLDLVLVRGENIQRTLLSIYEFLKGSHLDDPKDIIHIQSDEFKINFDENLKSDVDGEPAPTSPLIIKCVKGGVKIIY